MGGMEGLAIYGCNQCFAKAIETIDLGLTDDCVHDQ